MDAVILRKVAYKLPKTDRLTWAVVVSEAQGLALLFVTKPNGEQSHSLVVASENVKDRFFEAVNTSQFPIDHEDLGEVGSKLRALAENLSQENFRNRFFGSDDSWWKE